MIPYSEFAPSTKRVEEEIKRKSISKIASYIKKNGKEPSDITPFQTLTEKEYENLRRVEYARLMTKKTINDIVKEDYLQLLEESEDLYYWESHIVLTKNLEDIQSFEEIIPAALENVFEITPYVIHKHNDMITGEKYEERLIDEWYGSHKIYPEDFILSFEEAVIAYWNSPLRTTGNKITMRRPINPMYENPYYIFGQMDSPYLVFVNAVTGEVSTG